MRYFLDDEQQVIVYEGTYILPTENLIKHGLLHSVSLHVSAKSNVSKSAN